MDTIHTDVDRSAAALMGFYNHKRVHFSTDDALERGKVGGFNVQIRGDDVTLYPRLSRNDFSSLQDLSLHTADQVMQDLLRSMDGLTAAKRDKFMVDRTAVWKPMPDGGHRLILVPRVPKAIDEIDIIAGEPTEVVLRKLDVMPCSRDDLESRGKRRTYQLSSVFNDTTVLDKYDISLRQIEASKRLAATDPSSAARVLQDAMNACQDDVWVSIKAGAWSKSRKQAENTINWFCKDYKYVSEPYAVEFTDDKIFMYAPQGQDWIVSGPVSNTLQVRAIHALVNSEGRVFPSVLLSMECVLLHIDIGTSYSVAEPTITYHAGREQLNMHGISNETAQMLPADTRARLVQLADNLSPVSNVSGIVIATAIQVTDNVALINNHVLADTGETVYVDGQTISPQVQLSRDIWALARASVGFKPWQTRDAVVGEMAVLVGMSSNGFYVSPPIRVTSVDDTCVVTSRDPRVVAGMSGAALVSIRDLALLGVHSAATGASLLAYKFGPKDLSQLVMRDSSIPDSFYDDDTLGISVMSHFRRNGLLNIFRQAANCMVPLYQNQQHVAMAVVDSGRLLTTCSVDEPLYMADNSVPLIWSTSTFGVYTTEYGTMRNDRPVFIRKPRVLEKVFVLARNKEPYLAGQTQVSYVGLDAKSFTVKNFKALDVADGGLLVAWDGAVVGILGHMSNNTTVGTGIRCWPLPDMDKDSNLSPKEVLASKFPMLNLVAWPEDMLNKIFEPATCISDIESLQHIGINATKQSLGTTLYQNKVPFIQWSAYEKKVLDNSTLLDFVSRYSLTFMVNFSSVSTRASREMQIIGAMRAFIGLIALVETTETFTQFLTAAGLLLPDDAID